MRRRGRCRACRASRGRRSSARPGDAWGRRRPRRGPSRRPAPSGRSPGPTRRRDSGPRPHPRSPAPAAKPTPVRAGIRVRSCARRGEELDGAIGGLQDDCLAPDRGRQLHPAPPGEVDELAPGRARREAGRQEAARQGPASQPPRSSHGLVPSRRRHSGPPDRPRLYRLVGNRPPRYGPGRKLEGSATRGHRGYAGMTNEYERVRLTQEYRRLRACPDDVARWRRWGPT